MGSGIEPVCLSVDLSSPPVLLQLLCCDYRVGCGGLAQYVCRASQLGTGRGNASH